MAEKNIDQLTDALSAPLGDIISSVARGVADAQQALDLRTIETYRELYTGDDALREDLRQLGYQPTWYKIPEVNAEIVMSLTISEDSQSHIQTDFGAEKQGRRPLKIYAAPIDANYSNRYSYDIKGASTLRFKVVPVPPTPRAEQLKIVPALLGKPIDEAIALLEILDIEYELERSVGPAEKTPVANIVPEAGTILRQDQKLMIYLTSS